MGLIQGMHDLGLNDIAKADYTMHLVAGDEQRANFSLFVSCITGKIDGGKTNKDIKLYLSGVQCDESGSYVEGWPEENLQLMIENLFDINCVGHNKDWLVE